MSFQTAPRIAGVLIWCLALALFQPQSARAQYHSFNVPSGADCVIQDYRSPNLPPGIYDAIHEQYVTSSDGGSGYFYGGMVHDPSDQRTLVQFVCWPASGGFAPYSQQIPVFAGPHMVGYPQIGEGSSCAIKGYWPLFRSDLWTRFAVRFWQPADGTKHVGYQGIWMKDPVDGAWHHLGTFLYPFAVTGVNGMSGWQENFSGYTGTYIVEHARGYYHRAGAWRAANQVHFTAAGHVTATEGNTVARSEVGNPALAKNVPKTVTLSGQAALPALDPIVISQATATVVGSQWWVQWELPQTSSPQLGYTIEVFDNAEFSGSPVRTVTEREPEVRQRLLDLGGISNPHVRLTISDIFFNTSDPVTVIPSDAVPSPAVPAASAVEGLSYEYVEAASGDWTRLPDFSALPKIRSGSVNLPDVSPRRRRSNYGFRFTGFLNVPSDGLYAFTLRSGDGSRLILDGTTVIDFDGVHDSSEFKGGGKALAAGAHTLELQFFKGAANPVNPGALTDGLGLEYSGPGIPWTPVPTSAFLRIPASDEPEIRVDSPTPGAVVLNTAPGVRASVQPHGHSIDAVQFYLTSFESYYRRPAAGTEFHWGAATSEPFTLDSMIWSAPETEVRARAVYDGSRSIDSGRIRIGSTNAPPDPWIWSLLEMHNYPSGLGVAADAVTLLGDGMNLLSRKVAGDCVLTARLADLTPAGAGPDGVTPSGEWRAGIILRGNTNATLGQPLGDGSGTRFAALFSTVDGGTYFQDDTMRAGNGDANRWSANLGGGNRWYRLRRTGNTIVSSVSLDGTDWTVVNTVTLPNLGGTIHAGVFLHAVQSMNPNVHHARWDSFSLTGSAVVGPASVTVSPATNAVIAGLPAAFSASVVGPLPEGYRWQFNGEDITGATRATYSIASVSRVHEGRYTAVANGMTSAPAILVIRRPAGSGVWTSAVGGSWASSLNWEGEQIAGGVGAVADFSALALDADATVALNGARTAGTLVFGDLHPDTGHRWTVSAGAGGSLALAAGDGDPAIAVDQTTAWITAPISGSEGLVKTGPGTLVLSGTSSFTGTVSVREGTLEVQKRSGDVPYAVSPGATLKIGYSTGGGYAATGLTLSGDGAESPSGVYFAGGRNYNASGQIALLRAPTTLRQYGSGFANLGTFDINPNGLWCSAAASGSASDPNIRIVSQGYGMSMLVDAGAHGTTGDFTVRGPLGVGNLGLFKRGNGSLRLEGIARTDHKATAVQGGSVLCGVAQCLGANAAVSVSGGASLHLRGLDQSAGSLSVASGGLVDFGGTASLTVQSATLNGTLAFTLQSGGAPNCSRLLVPGRPLKFGGRLVIALESGKSPAAGEVFPLFGASAISGDFASIALPVLPDGLFWNTESLHEDGTLRVQGRTHALNYSAGPHGTLSGPATQTVEHGASGLPVTAVADSGFLFSGWSDGVLSNPRTDVQVAGDISVTAFFGPLDLTPPVILPSLRVVGGGVEFEFTGVPRQNYRVEYSLSLPADGPWLVLTNVESLEASPILVRDPAPASPRFYRVRLVP